MTKDRLYRTLDRLLTAQTAIENDLKQRFEGLFQLDYDLLLYDLTSSYFEGLSEENNLARRGYSRDHRGDCPQIVLALIVTCDGFPLAHETLAGNTQDVQTVRRIVTTVETRFGQSQRVWVMDRGMISDDTLSFLNEANRRYLLATRRHELTHLRAELGSPGWQKLPDRPGVAVKSLERDGVHYLLARSGDRCKKERAVRRRQRRPMMQRLRRLRDRVAKGRLKNRDTILERARPDQSRTPKAHRFIRITVEPSGQINWTYQVDAFRAALARDGAYLLRSNQGGWTAVEFWETYMQLATVERPSGS